MGRVGFGAFLLCLAVGVGQASAATVAFDFRGSSLPTGNKWVDQASGVAVTATPQSTLSWQTGYPRLTNDVNKGLGVLSGKSFLLPGDPLINFGESIQFAFDPTIVVYSITLTEMQNIFGFGDYVSLSYSDGTTTQKLAAVRGNGSGPYDVYTYVLPTPVTAVTFTIGSDSHLLDSFGVGGITVDYTPGTMTPSTEPRTVDLPASLWGGMALLGGLAGLRWAARRQRVMAA
jgi:hypothetical protein